MLAVKRINARKHHINKYSHRGEFGGNDLESNCLEFNSLCGMCCALKHLGTLYPKVTHECSSLPVLEELHVHIYLMNQHRKYCFTVLRTKSVFFSKSVVYMVYVKATFFFFFQQTSSLSILRFFLCRFIQRRLHHPHWCCCPQLVTFDTYTLNISV